MIVLETSCQVPKEGVNTEPVELTTQVSIGEEYTYFCNGGFKPLGNTTAVCTDDGTWSIKPPTCIGN